MKKVHRTENSPGTTGSQRGNMPTLKQLRYLVAISDVLHFRRAAEMSHVTQPTLSGQLRELEGRLGVQLVERSRTRVVLTPAGKEIAARARVILRDVDHITELAKCGQNLFTDTMRLGVPHTLGPYLLPHMLPEIHEEYPSLKLYVREGLPKESLHALEEGKLDVLLTPLPVTGAELVVERLFREPLLTVVHAGHWLANKDVINRADLKGETVLALEPGHVLHEQVRQLCSQYGAALSTDYEGTSLDTLRQMVGMGMGLSFLPALYVKSELGVDEQAVVRPMSGAPPTRTVGMVWRRQSARSQDYQVLADFIRGVLKSSVPEVTVLN